MFEIKLCRHRRSEGGRRSLAPPPFSQKVVWKCNREGPFFKIFLNTTTFEISPPPLWKSSDRACWRGLIKKKQWGFFSGGELSWISSSKKKFPHIIWWIVKRSDIKQLIFNKTISIHDYYNIYVMDWSDKVNTYKMYGIFAKFFNPIFPHFETFFIINYKVLFSLA